MSTLHTYMRDVQRLIRDSRQEAVDPGDIIEYINTARREVALRTQCIRVLPATSGAILSISLTAGGSGYTAPTLVISSPDYPSGAGAYPNGAQAIGTVSFSGGVITDIEITFGGAGYFNPVVSIADPTGSGATFTVNLTSMNLLTLGKEVYNFADVDLSPFPGVENITAVLSVSIIFSNYRYSPPRYSFAQYQALVRQYASNTYSYVPAVLAQFGYGSAGSLYFYPLPSQTYQMEWDCVCEPSDLRNNQDVEAIPKPWQDCVKFYAAHLAFLELQNYNGARAMLEMFEKMMLGYSKAARPGHVTNAYGRY